MEKGQPASSSSPSRKDPQLLTLQANFTFGTPTMAPVQYAHVTPTSSSTAATLLGGRPVGAGGAGVEHWRWSGGGGGGGGGSGAQCSITCGREGLTMTYNAPPGAAAASGHAAPCPACASLAAARPWHLPLPQAPAAPASSGPDDIAPAAASAVTRSLGDLSRPQEQPAARSLTFSGSLDRATQRPVQQRPYGRRCKSTAHIVLQTSDSDVPRETRPHEFHSTLRKEAPGGGGAAGGDRPEQAARGRARHRTATDAPQGAVGYGGWEHLQPLCEEQETARRTPLEAGAPPCCACHHCSAIYSLVSSLAHERSCHACAHRHHHRHLLHHHQPCPPCAAAEPCAPQAPKSPALRTFNSHRCYEEESAGVARRQAPSGGHLHHHHHHPQAAPQEEPRSRTPSPRAAGRRRRPSLSPRSSPSPDRRGDGAEERHPQPAPPQTPRRVPRMGAAAAAAAAASSHPAPQGDGGVGQASSRHRGPHARHQQRPRSRTIHIDVYCSSSSELDSSAPSSPVSEDTQDSSGPRRPHAVVALGSKQRRKTEVTLGRHQCHPLEERASSFVYSRGRPRQPHASRRTTFITDDVLPMCSSPLPTSPGKEEAGPGGADAPPSAPEAAAVHGQGAVPAVPRQSPIPMPAPPSRPSTLAMATSPLQQASEGTGVRPRSSHSSLSYLSSPMDVEVWEGEPELPESALSWRGSEFETSTPRLTSDLELHSSRPTSGLSLSSLHEAFCEAESEGFEARGGLSLHDSPRLWRSPQLERQRYIQRDQEERYREALKRRGQQEAQRSSATTTASNLMELSKLSAFKDFSREDLEVISKSLERRKSLQSPERNGSLKLLGEQSLEPLERRDSNRLLEWMKQYKAQESKESTKSQELKDSESLGYAESSKSLEGTDSFGSMESKESFGTVERRKSVPCSNGSLGAESSTGVQRRESQRSFELKELGHQERREPGKPLEKRDSFKFQDKSAYFRSLEKRESDRSSEKKEYLQSIHREASEKSIEQKDSLKYADGKGPLQSIERKNSDVVERRGSGRVERRGSDRAERKDTGRVERRISGKRVERSDSGRYLGMKELYVPKRACESEKRIERVHSFGATDINKSTTLTSQDTNKSPDTTVAGVGKKGSGKPQEVKGSGFLEQLLWREESSKSGSVEWQNVVSTVQRRLSACAPSPTTESPWSPEGEDPPVTGQVPTPKVKHEGLMSPILQRHKEYRRDSLHSDDEHSTTTIVGGRIINVGLFRRLPRFPFSQTIPVPASRLTEVRTSCFPEQRKFVRPQLFGEMTLSYPKRRGIHFGPPRNPQCSCENCRSWAEVVPRWQVEGTRLRAWSLSDLGPCTGESQGTILPQHPGSYHGTSLSRANSNVSDSATLSHVGSAAAGGKQQ